MYKLLEDPPRLQHLALSFYWSTRFLRTLVHSLALSSWRSCFYPPSKFSVGIYMNALSHLVLLATLLGALSKGPPTSIQ